ncbi:MAG: hypothetical protein ACRBBQ_16465 [Cognatishimia sp.]
MKRAEKNSGPSELLPIGSLWIGSSLNWIARLSLQSMLRAGHKVTLFHTGMLEDPNIDGLNVQHAKDIWDYPEPLLAQLAPAPFSDIFRLHMIRDARMIWADTDVLCVRPLIPQEGYLVGREHGGWINNAVLMLPEDSATLNELLACFSDPTYVPAWLHKKSREKAMIAAESERFVEASRLMPNALGPRAVSYMLPKNGEDKHVRAAAALNPVPWSMADCYFNPNGGIEGWLTDETLALHLYMSRIRKIHLTVQPLQGSFIAEFANQVGFDLTSEDLRRNTVESTMN